MSKSTDPTEGMKIGVVDFFSGCGGVSYGFSKIISPSASIEIVAGIDNDKHSCSTYRRMLNRPSHQIDISTLIEEGNTTLDDLRSEWALERFDKVILVGCAPCQGFAAHRKSIKGQDHRRSLFGIFSEIATRISPDAIFMENVPDMFSKNIGNIIKMAKCYLSKRATMYAAGYSISQTLVSLRRDFER